MKQRRFNLCTLAGMAGLTIGMMGVVNAYADDDRFTFNGFGNQDYRRPTANSIYMSPDSTGTWDDNMLGLVMSAKVNDKTRAWAQVEASSTTPTDPTGGVRLTWAFVDYQFNDSVSGHAGRIKFPYGLYNEVIDTQALRPSITAPSVYSQVADMAYKAYEGVGVDWHKDLGSAGSVLTQGYVGDIYNEPEELDEEHRDDNVIGGRVTYNTPVDGLRLMLSANITKILVGGGTDPSQPSTGEAAKEDRLMLSFDYTAHDWDIKSEYNWHKTPTISSLLDPEVGVKSYAYYVQIARDIGKFTPFARYDYVTTDSTQKSDPMYFQRSYIIGVGYKLEDNLNLRLEEDLNHGYALNVPELPLTPPYVPRADWSSTMASVNFMF